MPRYTAELAHMRDGELTLFESIEFESTSEEKAKRQATEWRITVASMIEEQTWLSLKSSDGSAILSEPLAPDV